MNNIPGPTALGQLIVLLTSAHFMAATATYAQEATNQPARLKTVVITGSMIPTAQTVGPAPVDTVRAIEVERIGSTDVLDALKKLSPSFVGNANVGQVVNNGGYGEAYIALRNLPTLVLINGHRLGNSAFSNYGLGTAAPDLNVIPLAMIERIEVLKDGASAIYGSQAVGGVINIITKQDFNGVDISGRYGFATGRGNYEEYRAAVVGGISSDKAAFVAGVQYFESDPLLAKDRSIASRGIQENLAEDLQPPSYISPSYPGRVQAGGVSYIVAGSPFAQGAPGYNPALSTPPVFPGQQFSGDNAVVDYNNYAIAQGYVAPDGSGLGPYLDQSTTPLGMALDQAGAANYPLLNTTLFGPAAIQSQDRVQAFANGHYDLYGKELQLFGDFLYADTRSIGALAPAPVVSLHNANMFVPGNNVFNPFGIDLGPVAGAATPRVRARFIESGNRVFDSQTDFYHIVGGLKGEFEAGYTYNAFYGYNRYDQMQYTKNAINGAALDLALQPNPDPALAAAGFSSLRSATGYVPMYSVFYSPTVPYPTSSGANSSETINAIKTTLFQAGLSEEWEAGGTFTGEPLELPAGKLSFAVGGGFRSESLSIDVDGLTRIGKVPGLNGLEPTSGRRDSAAGFVEVRLPLTSPELQIPALHSFEITAAGRYETFDPGGDSAVPKLGLRWQPLDEQVTLRGSYSQSFVAPTTFELFGGASQNVPVLVVGDSAAQLQTLNISNPDLEPVDAENFAGGIVISPKVTPGLTLSADYYHIRVENDIFRLSEQAMVNDLQARGSASVYAPNYNFDDGSVLASPAANQITLDNWGSLRVPLANGAETTTDGIDLMAIYRLSRFEETAGIYTFFANANVLFSFDYDDPTIHVNPSGKKGPYDYAGQYTDRVNGIGGGQGLLPDFILNTGLTWEIYDFTYSINARYIPEVDDPGTLHPAVGSSSNDFTVSGQPWKVEDYYTIDMQLAYEIGKHRMEKKWYDRTRLAVGVNNITDNIPPLIASSFEDNTDKSVYDILGRFVYFEISKKF